MLSKRKVQLVGSLLSFGILAGVFIPAALATGPGCGAQGSSNCPLPKGVK